MNANIRGLGMAVRMCLVPGGGGGLGWGDECQANFKNCTACAVERSETKDYGRVFGKKEGKRVIGGGMGH